MNMSLENIQISESKLVIDAISLLKKNGRGIVIVNNKLGKAVGIITDSDVRTSILKKQSLKLKVSKVMNKKFIYLNENYTVEEVYHTFSRKIKQIPILNSKKKLLKVLDYDYDIKKFDNENFEAFTKAPLRISLSGGGFDLSEFIVKKDVSCINVAINKFVSVLVQKRRDKKISISSYNEEVTFLNKDKLKKNKKYELFYAALYVSNFKDGINIYIYSDVKKNSGLGASTALTACLINSLMSLLGKSIEKYELAELCYKAERIYSKISGGWQDQYSVIFGGLNHIEFTKKNNLVNRILLEKNKFFELETNLLLCNIGNKHLGQSIYNKIYSKNNYLKKAQEITDNMKIAISKGKFEDFCNLMNINWKIKIKSNPKVTNKKINNIYNSALKNGAKAGRLVGTGGGGYMVLYCPINDQINLINNLNKKFKGLVFEKIIFNTEGLQSWIKKKI